MAKYIPHEKMTVQQIQAEIDREFQQWNNIACSGCQDPSWPDGVNMNLVRNHIIYWYRLLDEKHVADTQTSLFDSHMPLLYHYIKCFSSDITISLKRRADTVPQDRA